MNPPSFSSRKLSSPPPQYGICSAFAHTYCTKEKYSLRSTLLPFFQEILFGTGLKMLKVGNHVMSSSSSSWVVVVVKEILQIHII